MKRRLGGGEVEGVGVRKDEDLKFEEIEVSHTLGGYTAGDLFFCL